MSQSYQYGWTGGSQHRSTVARVLWAVTGVLAGIGGLILVAGGTFAPAEVERIQFGGGQSYHVDTFKFMYLVASALLPASIFSIWKASHRAGLGFWRSTVRPGAMCGSAALIGLGLSFSSFIAMGAMQGLGIIVASIGAAAMLFFWIVRGPSFELNAGDAYWNRALAMVFALFTLASGVGSLRSVQNWKHEGYSLERTGDPFTTQKVFTHHWDSESEVMRSEPRTYHVPRLAYNPQPISAGLLAILALGSLSEMRYRFILTRRARQAAFQKLF